jgi:hypothetical protein
MPCRLHGVDGVSDETRFRHVQSFTKIRISTLLKQIEKLGKTKYSLPTRTMVLVVRCTELLRGVRAYGYAIIRGGLARSVRMAGIAATILVGAWIARSVPWIARSVPCEPRGLTVISHAYMRSSHAPRTMNPEPRVREDRKTESRKTDSAHRNDL